MSDAERNKSLIVSNGIGKLPKVRIDADELSRPNIDEGRARLAEGTLGKKRGWPKGKKRGNQLRKTKLAILGIPSSVLDVGNQDYARCVSLASSYRKARVRELYISHGYVSSGATSLLASAALAIAASRYLYEKAALAGDGMLELLKTASRLADSARANELAAFELCARESVAKRKAHMAEAGLPWMVEPEEARKPGPKKKEELPAIGLPPLGSDLTSWVQDAITVPEVQDGQESGSGTETKDGGSQEPGRT